jgi:hypothetical protein
MVAILASKKLFGYSDLAIFRQFVARKIARGEGQFTASGRFPFV